MKAANKAKQEHLPSRITPLRDVVERNMEDVSKGLGDYP